MRRIIYPFNGEVALFSILSFYTFSEVMGAESVDKPNVIIILNDDQGYSDLSCYGASDIKTPNIDALAKSGIKFTDFYVASSVSSASRAALLTGCYPQRVGVNGVFFPGENGLNPNFLTIAEILKTAGYSTAAVGKWHLGDALEYLPTNQGFDSYFGIPYSNDMYPSKNIPYSKSCLFREGFNENRINTEFRKYNSDRPITLKNKVPLVRNNECIEFPCDQSTITERYADESINFIKQSVSNKTPFFLYLANSMPHIPLYVSNKFKGSSSRGLYGDVIQEIDYNVGRIIQTLEELEVRENTIVILLSDNGPWLAVGKDAGNSYPLFEGKFTSFEGGFRVPAIISWPCKIPENKVCNEIVSSIDIFPTIANISGVRINQQLIDGRDINCLFKNPMGKSPREEMFMVFKASSVRFKNWKFHDKGIVYEVKKTMRNEKGPALYDLKNDIGERKNVINKYPEIAKKLKGMLDAHKIKMINE